MTEEQVTEIMEPLRQAEAIVLAAMKREPKNYDLYDCKTAIWKAMDKARQATNE